MRDPAGTAQAVERARNSLRRFEPRTRPGVSGRARLDRHLQPSVPNRPKGGKSPMSKIKPYLPIVVIVVIVMAVVFRWGKARQLVTGISA